MINPILTLHITNAEEYGFYLHTLALSEGISSVSSALLTVYTTKAVTIAKLKELVSTTAGVKITQKNNAKQDVTRYFSGIITSVKHCGAAQKCIKGTVYRCMLKIESPLALLKHGALQRHSIDRTVGDVITEILESHNLSAEVPADIASRERSFYQGRSNDYEFLLRIFGEYSLNYIFKSSSEPLSPPRMHIFTDAPETVSEISPAPPENGIVFSCDGTKNRDCVMSAWEMSSSLGVDKIEIHYENTQGLKDLSAESVKDSARKRVFNTAPFGAVEDKEVQALADSLLAVFESSKELWQGHTSSLYAMPGMAIDVKGFDGSSNVIQALVTSSHLEVVAGWPPELGVNPDTTPRVEIDIRCCSRNAKQNSGISAAESDVSSAMCSMFQNTGRKYGKVELLTATVCDAAGSSDAGNSSAPLIRKGGTDTYSFYARTENDRMIVVHLTMPLGGLKQGLFRVPRLGDRILVQSNGLDSYYLNSYLPNRTDMPFADSLAPVDGLPDPAGMTVLRHTPGGMKMAGKSYASSLTNAAKKADNPLSGQDQSQKTTTGSELGIYSWHPEKKDDKDEGKDKKGSVIADTKEGEKNVPGVGDTMTVISQGDIVMSSNAETRIQGKNIYLTANSTHVKNDENGWDTTNANIKLKGFNTLSVDAANKIKFTVGGNSFSITPKGLTIRTSRWGGKGFMDSCIIMTGHSGTTITGSRLKVLGFTEASIGDDLGGGGSFMAGGASFSGAKISMRTTTRKKLIAKEIDIVAQALLQISTLLAVNAFNADAKETMIWGSNASVAIDKGLSTYNQITSFIETWKGGVNSDALTRVTDILVGLLNLGTTLINIILWLSELIDEDWLEEPIKNNPDFTKRDAMRLAAWVTMVSAWTITLSVLLIKMKSWKSSALQMSADAIEVETYEQSFFGAESIDSESLIAGQVLAADPPADQNANPGGGGDVGNVIGGMSDVNSSVGSVGSDIGSVGSDIGSIGGSIISV